MSVLLEALADAIPWAQRADPAQLQWLADSGRLVLHITVEDGCVYGEFYDDERLRCWDDCNGVNRFHRGGWCPFNPQHADMDCACLESYYDSDYEDEPYDAVAEHNSIIIGQCGLDATQRIPSTEEPF